MQIKSRLSVWSIGVLIASLVIGLPLSVQAVTPDEITTLQDYPSHVPEPMREIITPERYETIVKRLLKSAIASKGKGPLNLDTALLALTSPCGDSLSYLIEQFYLNPLVPAALDEVNRGLVKKLPAGYVDKSGKIMDNIWVSKDSTELTTKMLNYFDDWCEVLPKINGSHDNGLDAIQGFAWFFYQNQAGQDFVQGRNPLKPSEYLDAGRKFTKDFSVQRGEFMWSAASIGQIGNWIDDPRIEIEQYKKTEPEEYSSFNDFFSRELKDDQRPVTMPDADYVVVSPTDCIMNPLVQQLSTDSGEITRSYVDNPLQYDTVLDVKGIPISLDQMLGNLDSTIADQFVGGTGLSCVLMPNTYHHYHAPVDGKVIHKEVINNNTFGYIDWPNWVPLDGNVARPGTDFSQFEVFERGVVVIEVTYLDVDGKTKLTGYVASIPVGLDTIGSVKLKDDYEVGSQVTKGVTMLGDFFYGGSLNILLFSKGLASGAVQTRMGNQITLFNIGKKPESKAPSVYK